VKREKVAGLVPAVEKGLWAGIWWSAHSTRLSERRALEPNYWLADTSCPKCHEIKGLLWKWRSRAEKRDTDSKVLALSSELGNPHRTRVPTFPQQRLRRRTNLPKLQNPPKSQGLTDSCAEPEKEV